MAERIVVNGLPPDYDVALTSDWHYGARAHNDRALDRLLAWVREAPNRFLGFGGDAIEGKPVKSKHFDPRSLLDACVTIEQQVRGLAKKIAPVADRVLYWGVGNHDIYLLPDFDIVQQFCDLAGIPQERRGGYQTWIDLGPQVRVFSFHGRRGLPRGAKDPIQRDANQRAWLKRELEPLAGDRHVMLMGHVHALLVQPPIEQYHLLDGPDGIRARYFVQADSPVETRDEAGNVDTRVMTPELSRWYGCTGTLRRSGGFGYMDYAEVAGYPPSPIGWLEMRVRGGAVADIVKVVV